MTLSITPLPEKEEHVRVFMDTIAEPELHTQFGEFVDWLETPLTRGESMFVLLAALIVAVVF